MQRALARFAAAFFALIVLVGVLRAGARYTYCPAMRAVMDAPCCTGDKDPGLDEPAEGAEARAPDCCERHVLGNVSSGALAPSFPLHDAPLLAVLPPVSAAAHRSLGWIPRRFEHERRAGPSPARHRAELMVFLI